MSYGWRQIAVLTTLAISPMIYAKITNPSITNDQTNIYFKFTEKTTYSYYHVYIDSDNNANTGFSIDGIGADRLLENGFAYQSTGTGWDWKEIQAVTYSRSGSNLSWTMPLSILGAPSPCNTPIKIIFSGENASGAGDFSAVIDYTLTGSNCGPVISNPTASATDTQFGFSYQVSSPATTYQVYFDTDNNAGTGYAVGGIGADYMLQGTDLYQYAGSGPTWSLVKAETFNQSSNTVTWKMGRNDMGNFDCAGSIAYLPAVSTNGTATLGSKQTFSFTADPNCGPTPPPPTSGLSIAVPAYFDPDCASTSCNWGLLDSTIPPTTIAIINPDNGPGKSQESSYVAQVKTTQGLGAKVIGYVETNYGKTSISTVESQINDYYTWYNVDGIFLDEGSNSCSEASYYQTLYQYIHSKGGTALTVINPGTTVPECYAAVSDILVTFEDTYSNYVGWQPAGWESGYPASHFWHIAYSTPSSSLSSFVNLASQRHIGYVFATSFTEAQNPYGAMPAISYWTSEVALVNAAK